MGMPDRVRTLGLSPSDEARVFVWEDMVQGLADRFRIDHTTHLMMQSARPDGD